MQTTHEASMQLRQIRENHSPQKSYSNRPAVFWHKFSFSGSLNFFFLPEFTRQFSHQTMGNKKKNKKQNKTKQFDNWNSQYYPNSE